jgi:hypothetical protein
LTRRIFVPSKTHSTLQKIHFRLQTKKNHNSSHSYNTSHQQQEVITIGVNLAWVWNKEAAHTADSLLGFRVQEGRREGLTFYQNMSSWTSSWTCHAQGRAIWCPAF